MHPVNHFPRKIMSFSLLFGAGLVAIQACGSVDSSLVTADLQPLNSSVGSLDSSTLNTQAPLVQAPIIASAASEQTVLEGTTSTVRVAGAPAARSVTSIVNHEGRILGEAPTIKEPVVFNTPEADAILSSMQIMPKNSAWNEDISSRPVLANSTQMIASIGAELTLRFNADMGFIIVPPNFPKKNFAVTVYPEESDLVPFPIPDNLPIENWPLDGSDLATLQVSGTGDRHAIIVDPSANMLYELGETIKINGAWSAAVSAKFPLNSNALRPLNWTSTDAAGLPIFPAVVRYDEVARGMVEHAMRFTVTKTRRDYVYPATHYASSLVDSNLPAMGQRFRLKSTANLTGLPPHALAVAKGLQKYGMIVADNGGNWRISVAPDARITGLDTLRRFKGSDFEVIQTTGEFEGPRAK
jgi:hypothetical protein